MNKTLGIFIILIGLSTTVDAQGTKYYKDENLWKETTEKKAKFKKSEYFVNDTLFVEKVKISENLILSQEKWFNKKPVGNWTKYDLNGNLVSNRNFDLVVYSKEPIEDIFNNVKENEDYPNSEPATYPGGESEMFRFLGLNLRYPPESRDNGSMGRVIIRIIIDENGNVQTHSIYQGVDPFIDLETWQLLEKMPNWNPAKVNGTSVKSYIILPVVFKLS